MDRFDEEGAVGPQRDLQNLEAEAALLGALLIDNEIIEGVLEHLKPADFAEPVHQRIAQAIWDGHAKGQKVTPVTLKPQFDRDEGMAELGGAVYLARLTADGQGLLAWRDLAAQISEFARLRTIVTAARYMQDAYLTGDSFEAATALVDDALAAGTRASKSAPVRSGGDMIGLVTARADRLTDQALGENVGVRTTTVSDLNALLAPIEDGTFIVLGGRPSMGKSTLASSAAWGFAANGHPTEFIAAESTEDHLAMRFAADLSLDTRIPITHEAIRKDLLTPEERAHYAHLAERAATLPIGYQVIGRVDIRRVRAAVARAAAKWEARGQRLRVVIVDYMQLFSASENGHEIFDDRRRINAVSSALVDIAKDFNCVVIGLSQLSRALEQREDKRPRLADLRESGRIEEDADVVLFVYREEYYLERAKPEPGRKDFEAAYQEWQSDLARTRDRVDLILAKNRHGDVKTRTAKFYGKYTAIRGGDFEPPAPENELQL